MSREIDTSGGTITKDELLYLAARENIPATNLQRAEALEDVDEENLRRVLSGEVDPDEWDPSEVSDESGEEEEDEQGENEE
jgi:hypothetical protein